jgi:hypothetical protein
MLNIKTFYVASYNAEKANEPHAMSKEKLRKVLVMVESIVSVARCTFTPFHPSLAIELSHVYEAQNP